MKFLILLPLIAAAIAYATPAPFHPAVDDRFNALESRATALEASQTGGTLASGKIVIGSTSNVATARTPSGDVTVSSTGVTAIGAGKVLESMLAVPTADGLNALRVARATFDFADGDLAVGAHGLGVTLPAKSIIIRSFIHIQTQLSDSGTCTLAISCEDANNIKTATDITGSAADALIEGESTGAASAFKKSIAADCEITATVADGGSCVPATGKGEVFVEYVVHN